MSIICIIADRVGLHSVLLPLLTMFCLLIIEQIDSMLPGACTVIDHKRLQNVAGTSMTHFSAFLLLLFCSYCIFMSSIIYYCRKRPTETWNLFVNWIIFKEY